ncbi:NAD(P)H-dependent oxidoreductase [Candidatus Parcubacteria bacterium]|nr:NAD(P)H-dependent oxidoreductase [Candidatus Parcubacteria bacterium]
MLGFGTPKKKKIFILLGHPDKDTLNGALADEYERGAKEIHCEVRRMNLGEMQFDPILHKGYKVRQELEPDLLKFQENVKWADHFVIFYPSWWSTMPALLKGLIDRVWLPGFAYNFIEGGYMWKRLMKGKSASMIITSDTAPLIQWLVFGDTTNELKKGILWFAGFGPIYVHKFGYLKHFGQKRADRIKNKVYRLGKRAR